MSFSFSKQVTLYFVKPKGMSGPIKIGCSTKTAARIEGLNAWSPFPLEVIGTVPGTYADEQFLHRCFWDSHSHNEWFFASERLGNAIAAIIAFQSVEVVRHILKPVVEKKPRRIVAIGRRISHQAALEASI